MTVFYDTLAVPGAWADALQFALFRVEPYEPQQRVFDPFEGSADTDARALMPPVSLSLHSPTDKPEGQDNHA